MYSLKNILTTKEVCYNVTTFFEEFKLDDLFLEIFELSKNKRILDKQELYLYFYDITFNKVKYPLFYIPINIVFDKDIISIEFDSQIYMNKKVLILYLLY